MAEIGWVDRARIAMAMLHVGNTVDDADVTNAPRASVEIASRYADALYANKGPQLYEADGVTPRDPTNVEKARFWIKMMVFSNQSQLRYFQAIEAGKAAEEAERVVVDAQVETDFGDQES